MDDEWIAEKGLLPAQTLSMSGALSSDDTTVNTDRPLSELPVPTCFGSLRDIYIRLISQPQYTSGTEQTQRLLVTPKFYCNNEKFWYGMQWRGEFFAFFTKKLSQGFHKLLPQTSVRLEAVVDFDQVIEKTKFLTRRQAATMTIEINIYGNRRDTSLVGNTLSSLGLYLQQPVSGFEGHQYYNPHFLHMQELSGIDVQETPIFDIGEGAVSMELGATNAAESAEVVGGSEEITSILDSLSQNTMLQKRGGSSGLRTALKDHQMEALDFVFRRETLMLTPELALWQPIETGIEEEDTVYRHKVTGTERSRAYGSEVRGGIIADEMGLGKTMVILATIVGSLHRAAAFASKSPSAQESTSNRIKSKATLVVVPSSILIDSWLDEIHRHVPHNHITVFKYHGPGRQERTQQCSDCDIVFTTYKTLISELQPNRTSSVSHLSVLHAIEWFRIVLDEAHEVRNRSTKQYQVVASLAAKHRWCLTGTPIQNSLEDLASLVSFLRIPLLEHPATFRKFITKDERSGVRHRYKNLRLFLKSTCLRRTKQVAGLPEPVTQIRDVDFSEAERRDYDYLLDRIRKHIDLGVSGVVEAARPVMFQAMLQLRLFCNHGRMRPNASTERDMEDVLAFLQQNDQATCVFCSGTIYTINDQPDTDGGRLISSCTHLVCRDCYKQDSRHNQECPACAAGDEQTTVQSVLSHLKEHSMEVSWELPPNDLNDSPHYPSKLLAFADDVNKHMQTGIKSIVFSYWKTTLDLVGKILGAQNVSFYFIHGSVPHKKRRQAFKDFGSADGHALLLMTLGTGAVGLNLAIASRIYLLEPQWNPFLEQQAFGRAQRLGQSERVTIIRYFMRGTVEDNNVRSRQGTKLRIALSGFQNPNQRI